jgi:hypothetical protein
MQLLIQEARHYSDQKWPFAIMYGRKTTDLFQKNFVINFPRASFDPSGKST